MMLTDLTLSAPDDEAIEGGGLPKGDAELKVAISNIAPSGTGDHVFYVKLDTPVIGTNPATPGVDFRLEGIAPTSVVYSGGGFDTSERWQITIPESQSEGRIKFIAESDNENEQTEHADFLLEVGAGQTDKTIDDIVVSIENVPPGSEPTVSLKKVAGAPPELKESFGSTNVFLVERTGSTNSALQVDLTISGTATQGAIGSGDYVFGNVALTPANEVGNHPVVSATIPAGQSSAIVSVDPRLDSTSNESEVITLTLDDLTTYNVNANFDEQSIPLEDDDSDPTVTFSRQTSSVSEIAAMTNAFRVTRSTSSGNLSVSISIDEGAATNPEDYIIGSESWLSLSGDDLTVNFADGIVHRTIRIDPKTDLVTPETENITWKLLDGADYDLSGVVQRSIALIDVPPQNNDPLVEIEALRDIVSESSDSVTAFKVTRSNGTGNLDVEISIDDGTAHHPSDYTIIDTPTWLTVDAPNDTIDVSFAPGVTERIIMIDPVLDSITPESEFIQWVVVDGTDYNRGSLFEDSITIADVDDRPAVWIEAKFPNATEGGEFALPYGLALFRVYVEPQQSVPFTVDVRRHAGMSEADLSDYVSPTSDEFSITIPTDTDGTTNWQHFTVNAIDDQIWEGVEDIAFEIVDNPALYRLKVVDEPIAVGKIYDPYGPPVFLSPDEGEIIDGEVCGTGTFIVDVDAEDSDRYGEKDVTYTLVNTNQTLSIDPASGEIEFDETTPAGMYPVTVEVTDNEGETATRQFTVNWTVSGPPGDVTVSLANGISDPHVALPLENSTGDVTLQWTNSSDADEYDYELSQLVDGNYQIVSEGSQDHQQATTQQKTLASLGFGVYFFKVRGVNCDGANKGEWAGKQFTVIQQGDLQLDDPSQDNNWEDACECSTETPPSEMIGSVDVLNGRGDLWVDIANFFGGAAEALSGFMFPVYQTGGLASPTITSSAYIPATPNAVQVTLSVLDTLGSVIGESIVDLDPADFVNRAAGLFSVLFDPSTLTDSNGQPVASLASGNYDVDVSFDLEFPAHPDDTADHVAMSITADSVSLDYENPTDTTFASKLAAGGVDRLRIRKDENAIVESLTLVRSNSTSVRFEATGTGFTTPDGSFVDVSASSMTIPDPNGGSNRTAAYRLLSINAEEQFFDSEGLLLATCTPHGDDILFGYDSNGAVNQIESAHTDESVSISVDETQGKTTITDWAGRTYVYTFTVVNGERVVNRVQGPARGANNAGVQLDLGYNADGKLDSLEVRETSSIISVTPEQSYSFTYDDAGNVDLVTWKDVKNFQAPIDRFWDFDSAESARMESPLKRGNGWGTVAGSSAASAFSDDELVEQLTYPDGSIATYTTDAFGNVLNLERTVENSIGPTVIQSSVTRNANGQVTTVQPVLQFINGNLNSTVPGNGYSYDAKGRLAAITYPDGTSESWTYTSDLSTPQPDTYTNRIGNFIEYEYGDPTSLSTYGEHQSPTKVTISGSQNGTQISTSWFEYESDGSRLKTAVYPDPNGIGGPRLAVEYFYDDHKNLIHIRETTASNGNGKPTLNASTNDIWTSFGYDSLGNLDWSTSAYQVSSLNSGVPSVTDPGLLAVKYEIETDNLGAVTSITTPTPTNGTALTTVTNYDFLGRVQSTIAPGTDAAVNRTTSYEYNSFGELDRVTLPDPDNAGSLQIPSATFDYDKMGHLVQQSSFNGGTQVSRTWYQTDSLGRITRVSLPLGDGLAADSSNATPADANTFFMEYDAVGRTTVTKQPVADVQSSAAAFFITSTSYNDTARQIQTSFSREGSVAASGLAGMTQTFDAIGRLKSESQGGLTTSRVYFDDNLYGNFLGGSSPGTMTLITDSRGESWWTKQGPTGQQLATWTPDPGPGSTEIKTQTDYDHRGNMIVSREWADGTQRATTYDFDYRDLLTDITLPIAEPGQVALKSHIDYDVLHRIDLETSATGEKTQYGYRDDGLLGTVTRLPLSGIASSGRTVTVDYDNLNRQISVTTPDGTSETFYDALGNVRQTLSPDPDGAGNSLSRISRTFTYDTALPGQYLSQVVDTDGSTTKFSNDRAGRTIEVFAPNHQDGAQAALNETGAASATRTSWFEYDAAGQLKSSSQIRSGAPDTVSYQYDSLGRMTQAGDGTRNEVYQYNGVGDLTSYTDPLGRVTQFEAFDGLGRATEVTRQIDGSDNDTTKTVYDGWGRIESVTDLYGVAGKAMTTSYSYDELDRIKTVEDALQGESEYIYDDRGFLQQADNQLDHSTYFKYDDFGRLEATWQEGFSESNGATVYTYDTMDRIDTVTDPLGNITDFDYDAVGRMTTRTEPGARITSWTYDDTEHVASITDPTNNKTEYFYDHRDQLRRDRIVLNGQNADRNYWYDEVGNLTWSSDREIRWTEFQYEFAYGASGDYQLVREGWWLPGFSYDNQIHIDYNNAQGNGLLPVDIYEIDASDSASPMTSRIEFDYDGLARPETITSWIDFTSGEEEAFQLKYKYEDKVNRRTQVEAAFVLMDGGTESDAMPDYRIDYDWDKLNRVDMISQSNLTYDANPANWGIEANSTETVDLQYRADSSYDEIIRTDGFGNSITTDFTYHSDGQKHEGLLASMNHEWETNPFGATDSAAYALTFDDHSRVATYTTPEGTRTYGYDNVDQLTSVTGSSTESYQYDANGNRSSGTTVSAYNRITQDADYNYTYDKDGNRLTRTDRTTLETEFYSWDYRHRLTQVVIRSSSSESSSFVSGVEYEYDALDRRTIRRELISDPNQTSFGPPLLGGVEQRFLYDSNVLNGGFDEVVLIIDEAARKFTTSGGTGGFGGGFGDGGGSGNSTPETGHDHVQHRFLNGADVDQVFADETTTDFLWYLTDHQNSVTDVVESESSGATNRNHIEYDSFGNIITVDDPSTATVDDGDLPGEDDTYSPVRGYTGREPDALTGLIYYRARWFDPNTGTFVSEDPIGFAAGDTNLTRYAGNGTPNATDPSGLAPPRMSPRISQLRCAVCHGGGGYVNLTDGLSDYERASMPEMQRTALRMYAERAIMAKQQMAIETYLTQQRFAAFNRGEQLSGTPTKVFIDAIFFGAKNTLHCVREIPLTLYDVGMGFLELKINNEMEMMLGRGAVPLAARLEVPMYSEAFQSVENRMQNGESCYSVAWSSAWRAPPNVITFGTFGTLEGTYDYLQTGRPQGMQQAAGAQLATAAMARATSTWNARRFVIDEAQRGTQTSSGAIYRLPNGYGYVDIDATAVPLRPLNTARIQVRHNGVDVVERHLGHFRNAGGNLHGENVHMLSRLRRIANGELKPLSQDLNFYSHELRESVRFRAAAISNNAQPAFQSVYRNSHYATLREYGFSFDVQEYAGQLYTPQALSFQGR